MTGLVRAAGRGLSLIAVFLAAGPSAARGQDGGRDAEVEEPAGKIQDTRLFEAQARFRLGVQLYAQGHPTEALAELRRAYALVPNYRVLFNLGEVAYQCHDFAAALRYLTRYLDDGGARIPEGRRREVARDLAELRTRVGYLSIQVPEVGARVVLDDVEIGKTPLATPVAANPGPRHVELLSFNTGRQVRTINLHAGETAIVSFDAPELENGLIAGGKPAPKGTEELAHPPRAKLAYPVEGSLAPVTEPPPVAAPAPPPTAAPGPSTPKLTLALSSEQVPRYAPLVDDGGEPARTRASRPSVWVTWTLAAAAAAGAAVTGSLAWSASRSLQEKNESYPVKAADLRSTYDRERRYALASDGLLAGTLVLSALALYLTLRDASPGGETHAGRLEARADW